MSTRWHPRYQIGNPQLRVFLSNFWMKLVRPIDKQPPNVVHFIVSMEMNKYDVKNYLERIYKVQAADVRTHVMLGRFKRDPGMGYVLKEDDYKMAFVTLKKDEKFEFPNLFPKEEEKLIEEKKQIEESKKAYKQFLDKSKKRPGVPGWFSF
ncbi:hypothetical protein L9F63_022572 [Diploptera punctata]|uniref:Large ribosomal subunit protein uL23m n=1 Tax=Diploptera punctata TaxID=6984 RepID=A0AAD7ZM85_DIPPU|nr:hypothetical protein L9F63_022572 [Diploptera punctata]